jgi:hypothetical protein
MHAEATHQAIKRFRGAVVGERLERLHPVDGLGVLVDGPLDVLGSRAFVAFVFGKQVEEAHVRVGGLYTITPSGSAADPFHPSRDPGL